MRALPIVLLALVTRAHAQAPGQAAPSSGGPPGAGSPAASPPTSGGPPGASQPQAAPPTSAMPPPPAGPVLTEIDVEAQPVQCRKLAGEANAKALVRALGARLSLASCLADTALEGLSLIDGQESVLVLEDAIAPSRALLDEVIEHAAPENQLLAQRSIAVLYAGAVSRMLSTVPPPLDGSDAAQTLRDIRLANVETMLAPWREQETNAHAAIVKLADAYPRLARDRAFTATIKASRARIGKPVASQP